MDITESTSSRYIVSDDLKPCKICGRLTRQIEFYSEERICRELCLDKFRREVETKESMYKK